MLNEGTFTQVHMVPQKVFVSDEQIPCRRRLKKSFQQTENVRIVVGFYRVTFARGVGLQDEQHFVAHHLVHIWHLSAKLNSEILNF